MTKSQKVAQPSSIFGRQTAPQSVKTISSMSIEPFKLTRTMLSKMILHCSDVVLSDSLDLLSCCDIIMAVMDRTNHTLSNGPSNRGNLNSTSVNDIHHGVPLIENEKVRLSDKENIVAKTLLHDGSKEVRGRTSTISAKNDSHSIVYPMFEICETNYTKDGVLLDPEVIFAPLLLHTFKELQRRKGVMKGATGLKPHGTLASSDVAEGLIDLLQRSECHMLACRVLLSSWSVSRDKSYDIVSQVRQILISQ